MYADNQYKNYQSEYKRSHRMFSNGEIESVRVQPSLSTLEPNDIASKDLKRTAYFSSKLLSQKMNEPQFKIVPPILNDQLAPSEEHFMTVTAKDYGAKWTADSLAQARCPSFKPNPMTSSTFLHESGDGSEQPSTLAWKSMTHSDYRCPSQEQAQKARPAPFLTIRRDNELGTKSSQERVGIEDVHTTHFELGQHPTTTERASHVSLMDETAQLQRAGDLNKMQPREHDPITWRNRLIPDVSYLPRPRIDRMGRLKTGQPPLGKFYDPVSGVFRRQPGNDTA